MNFPHGWYKYIFFHKHATIPPNIDKNLTSWWNANYPSCWYFKIQDFFFSPNTLIFSQKLTKFVTNHQNINFSALCNIVEKISYYFAQNWQNLHFSATKCRLFGSNVMTKMSLTRKFSAAVSMTAAVKITKRSKVIPPLHFWLRFLSGFTLISKKTHLASKKADFSLKT